MWPFNKAKIIKEPRINPANLRYSQLDITERFGDNLKLGPEEWIETIPIKSPNPEDSGLPPQNASPEKVYETATSLSSLREQISLPADGVYCPICHVANIQVNKLHTPCPKCGRKLLKFGWD
ncbi:MAG: hypothetical protein COV91_05895 [Candidatus Taylorbacteria bacterium CG11_big_fil_rev_8_21_14_0_20_46_11]|uniref:Uncharacterized protein n=1 Tax=Candidatus Taylorbacteria bacterium CG11_big_fil_rev_8_21_14_0_20_46_11 TaxID=1975025 RepID=A0A2H0KA31_9BACT|nr:MAG: hypothetical protein COV91_05895 [Candidatus Taylorbacteria bacterium CG11_big_fil_rev_8_21_14_0_20_46_11]